MALKQQPKTAEMVTNNTKMGWNCDSDKKTANTLVNTDGDMASRP